MLSQYGQQRALILFISEKTGNYRLSLVTIDLKWEEGKRVKKEYSNPRRYSFFLGPDSRTHTPEEYLLKPGRIKDFEDLKKRFSIEVVNKEFYTGIAILFTQLAGGKRAIGRQKFDERGILVLPSTTDDTLRKEFAVRLIGRLVFCWFLKKKRSKAGISLLSEEILSSEAVNKAGLPVRSTQTGNSPINLSPNVLIVGTFGDKYYHNILEPLFFQVLNTPTAERKRIYQKEPWSQIPFLNGGLFTPHQHDFYVPGVMDISRHINTLKAPDRWFKELFELFETYNFTIDENTSMDVELSIDPEMLGRIFENLLAEINPETGETARKATGSYYTPRPVVDYMVDESLKQCLLTKTNLNEETISLLLAYEIEDVPLSDREKEEVINALDTIKVLDPACGSGAFPMGILQKMLLILQKVDPDSKVWFTKQIAKLENPILRKEIETKLKSANVNYIHKLGIIQSAIYGVDIQPIAVDISKLRFFLSLIVDEKVNDDKGNRGIEPLPNLEFKFVCANSLIGLPKKEVQQTMFEATSDIDLLKNLRDSYLRSYGKEKASIEKIFRETQSRMFEHSLNWINHGGKDTQTLKLSQWDPFSFESCGWFDPEWMFGISPNSPLEKGDKGGCGGFDVVIANPPYGLLNKRQNQVEAITVTPQQLSYYKRLPDYAPAMGGMINIFKLFILKSIYLLKNGGIFSEIFPLAFIADSSAANLRNYILNNCCIQFIEAFPERDDPKKRVFEAAKMSVCVMNLRKIKKQSSFFIRINCDRYIDEQKPKTFLNTELIALLDKANLTIPLMSQEDVDIIANIYRKSIRFGDIGHCYTGEIDITLGKPYISYNSQDAPLLRGAIIDRYLVRDKMSQGEFLYLKKQKYLKENSGKKATHFRLERIAMQGITGVNEKIRLKMTLLDKDVFCANSINYIVFHDSQVNAKFALGILNSRLMNYIFSKFSTNSNVNGYEIDNLPYPKIRESHIQQPFIALVDQVLTAKQQPPSSPLTKGELKGVVPFIKGENPNADTTILERQIDEMVYKLYNLNPEEITIVEGKR